MRLLLQCDANHDFNTKLGLVENLKQTRNKMRRMELTRAATMDFILKTNDFVMSRVTRVN